jgi:hypothetical protein
MKATNTLAHTQLSDAAATRQAWARTLRRPAPRRRHRTPTALRLVILVAALAWLCLALEILKGTPP